MSSVMHYLQFYSLPDNFHNIMDIHWILKVLMKNSLIGFMNRQNSRLLKSTKSIYI